MKKVTLCDPSQQYGCPTVEVAEEQVILKDDLGGEVKLTMREWKLLKQKIRDEEI